MEAAHVFVPELVLGGLEFTIKIIFWWCLKRYFSLILIWCDYLVSSILVIWNYFSNFFLSTFLPTNFYLNLPHVVILVWLSNANTTCEWCRAGDCFSATFISSAQSQTVKLKSGPSPWDARYLPQVLERKTARSRSKHVLQQNFCNKIFGSNFKASKLWAVS